MNYTAAIASEETLVFAPLIRDSPEAQTEKEERLKQRKSKSKYKRRRLEMIVYCDDCDYIQDIEEGYPPHTCPDCGSSEIFFEKDWDWNQICGMWAMGHGWAGHPDSSLAEWYYREDRLGEWNNLKDVLTDPTRIVPPASIRESKGSARRAVVIKFWLAEAGLIETWKRSVKQLADKMGMEVYKPPSPEEILWGSYRMIRKLGKAYVSFWNFKTR